ncbi:MAG: adenylyltransferase/cytidyltransferase family protein [Aeriscardovia sp.]|nr:adenylyltransferase/cytidyltransferase family protein [Aeriscardovia sp.]
MRTISIIPEENGAINWPTEALTQMKSSVVTIGSFDGVHCGHQSILHRVTEIADHENLRSIVILFSPQPGLVHHYAKTHHGEQISTEEVKKDSLKHQIMSISQRIHYLEQLKIDEVYVITYTLAFANNTYQDFLNDLVASLKMSSLVLGEDAQLGKNREGTIPTICSFAQDTRLFSLEVVHHQGPGYVTLSSSRQVRAWSSTYIRSLLQKGQISDATSLLGHYHVIEGEVVHGEQRGRELGFPTANLGGDIQGLMPSEGVYSGWLVDCGLPQQKNSEEKTYPAAISIGTKETFADDGIERDYLLEANILHYPDWIDLYQHHVRIIFLERLRGQIKFDSIQALIDQIKQDADIAYQQTSELCGKHAEI